MIKKTLYIVALFTALLLASCSDDNYLENEIGEINEDYYAFSLSLQADGDVTTRVVTEPGVDDLHENVIEEIELFFYDGEALVWQVPKSAFTMTDGDAATKKKLIIRVPNDITSKLNAKNVTLVAIANGPKSEAMANKTLTQLKQHVFTSNDLNIRLQYGFLMEGTKETGKIVFDASKPYNLGTLSLQRVAAKIRLKLNKLNVPGYEASVPTSQLVNYIDKTNLLANSQVVNAPLKSTKYVNLKQVTVAGSTFYTTEIPYYSYENNWNADGSSETFILLKIPFTKDGKTVEYFYRIPFNYRLGEGGSEVRRNHLYEISVAITELGATTGEEPIEVKSSVEVKPWESVDIIQSVLVQANYLVVRDRELVMLDVNEVKIEYISNSAVTLVEGSLKAKFTAYDKSGTPSEGTPTANMPKITTIVENNKKYIKVVSLIPTNYVPIEIEFLVENEGDLRELIRITQYPGRYVTAKKSNGQFYKGSESGPGPTHKNFNLFTVTTVVTDGPIIGDPVDPADPEGKTMDTDEANNIISPQFIIASQNGVTLQRNFNTGTGNAVNRCINYFEDDYGPGRKFNGRWRLPTKAEIQYIQKLQRDGNSAVKSLLEGDAYWSGRGYWFYDFNNGRWNDWEGTWLRPNYNKPDNKNNIAHIRCVFDVYKYPPNS